jgi:hypothetical protein
MLAAGMSVIGVLRSLSLIVASALALAIGLAVVAGAEVMLLASVALLSPQGCTSTVHQRIARLPDFDVELRDSGCNILGNDATTSVFISRVGGTTKTLLFKYVPPIPDGRPTVASLDGYTVQISVRRVPFIFCRRDKWETLTVKYDIGGGDSPARGGASDEC